MGRGRRILLAVWIVANLAVLAIPVVNPQVTRSACDGQWVDSPALWLESVISDEEFGEDFCSVATSPLAERGAVAWALLGNGVALALWRLTGRPKSPPSN